mmetsp:Transcript_11195/g.18005  ORF Transcript_11195/g.18005 Transcript_11195/m.18005 type:complete len:136 (-) Transcript_11195:447-854(-)
MHGTGDTGQSFASKILPPLLLRIFKIRGIDKDGRAKKQTLLGWRCTFGKFNFIIVSFIVRITESLLGDLGHSSTVSRQEKKTCQHVRRKTIKDVPKRGDKRLTILHLHAFGFTRVVCRINITWNDTAAMWTRVAF